MKITFLAIGAENLGIEALSAALKGAKHEVTLAYDPSLFDDLVYYKIPFLARLFNVKSKIIKKVVASKPDLIGINVFVDNFKWACYMAREIKKIIDVPVIFGGVFPTACPERVLKEDCVDMICLGEGEEPLLELISSMEKGEMDYNIKNLWFKKDGKIIKNEARNLQDLDKLPLYDKALFEGEIPAKNYYLTVTQKGCPFNCTYCEHNFLRKFDQGKGKHLRRRSIDNILEELKIMKERYKFKEIDFKDNVFTVDKQWTLDFLKRYQKEINLPFRILSHPLCIDEDIAKALKEAGVHRIQLGIQSLNQKTRNEVLKRFETDEQIMKCFRALDKYKVDYSVDHIFGLPGETEEDLITAAKIYAKLKSCSRVTVFWLTYFPKTDMVEIARKAGLIGEKDMESIENGQEPAYQSEEGSLRDKKLKDTFKNYQLLFRIIPTLPEFVVNFILDHKLQRYFKYLPRKFMILLADHYVSFARHDYAAIHYLRYYLFQMKKVMKLKILNQKYGVYR
ncbi:MAG: radical SAM protein [Candidatus Nealsonbacteria bacterium]